MNISAWAVRNPVPVVLLFVLLLVGGLISFSRLAVQSFPDLDLPLVFIDCQLDGAAPDQLESKIAATADAIEAADPILYPHLAAIDPLLLFSGEGIERYTWAVNVLIDGVLAAIPPTPDTSRLAFKRD